MAANRYQAASYHRLSREDGDRVESDSITNQQHVIADFCRAAGDIEIVDEYSDDGYTGTNFERPDFKRMIRDVESGRINCIVVKDLSRFGRDYIDVGFYLERYFPAKGVRFIAINDGVDSGGGAYDMLLPIKNVFNAQYALDISMKVRSAFKAKQRRGEFCGAFACYGYLKDPKNNDRLVIDPVAAETVRQIFALASDGIGKQAIADKLNGDCVPCPSEYKRLMGTKYHNGRETGQTGQWTYAAVHRIIHNEVYTGCMVANRHARQRMHGKAKTIAKDEWIVVEGKHEPIVSRELWESVQRQSNKNARSTDEAGHGGIFTGFLWCGDCGKRLVKIAWNRKTAYSCGNYHRYGTAACTKHFIMEDELTETVLEDLNRVIGCVKNVKEVVTRSEQSAVAAKAHDTAKMKLEESVARLDALKCGVYEDFRDGLLSKEDYESYRDDYAAQLEALRKQLAQLEQENAAESHPSQRWVERLGKTEKLDKLDRATVAQLIESIHVYEDGHIRITYRFSSELGAMLNS